MRAADLDLRELLSFEPRGGIIRFGNERALLLDAVALGLLRRELIETLGITGARALLTRFGYAHGWRTAETMRQGFPWDSEDEWRKAGGWLHTLQGLVRVEPTAPDVTAAPRPIGNSVWHDSYEAEQHLLHLGRAEESVCWMTRSCVGSRPVRAWRNREAASTGSVDGRVLIDGSGNV